jgi:dTDP-4-amino-4,6-dideoxygalactose transaminase
MKLQMVDLYGQYKKIQKEIDDAILDVVSSCSYINGPDVKGFQKNLEDYLGVRYVIPCANGTDALQVALMALELKEGDEIICPDFTFVATAEVVKLLGLKAVFVDVNKDHFTIDIEKIRKSITPKTKAIIPVHLFGQCANMEKIQQIAKENNLYVIEDTAQSIGADFIFKNRERKKAGTIGDIGTTSFFPSKNLGCYGDGGAIFTNNDALAEKMRKMVNHGMEDRYNYKYIGVNSRLDSMQATILNIKLKHLESYNAARIGAANYYDKYFSGCEQITTPKRADFSTHVFHQYTLIIKNTNRDKLSAHLQNLDIPFGVYYPVPLHHQLPYSDNRFREQDFSVTNMLCKTVLSLPMHTELTNKQMDYISNTILDFIND